MIYTHILQQGGQGVQSPLDDLGGDPCFHPADLHARSQQTGPERKADASKRTILDENRSEKRGF